MGMKNILLLSVMVMLVSQIFLVEGNKQRGGKKDREGTAKEKQRGETKEEAKLSPTNNGKSKGSKGGKGSLQGKFVSKDKAECVWSASGAENVILNIDCTKGESRVSCSFGGNPTACPSYAGNQKPYWKQITRALRKQKNICQDQKAVLKSKLCKTGPKEAHFSYITPSKPSSEQEGSNPAPITPPINKEEHNKGCEEDAGAIDNRRLAEEYCSDSWSTLCTFFFSMVQSKSC